jgi:general secretion pathway protein G
VQRLARSASAYRGTVRSLAGYVLGFVAVPLLAGVLSHIAAPPDYGKRVSALATARMLAALLDQYRADQMRLPDARSGLQVLVPTYIDRLPRDPWGYAFVYAAGNDGLWADVISYGAEGASGGTAAAGDISARFGPLTPSRSWVIQALENIVALLVPIAAFASASRWPWARSVAAGSAGLYSVLLLALLGRPMELFVLVPFGVAVASLIGSFTLLTRARGAVLSTAVAIVLAHMLLAVLVTE